MKQTHAEEFRTSFPWCGTKTPNVDVTKAWAPSGTFRVLDSENRLVNES